MEAVLERFAIFYVYEHFAYMFMCVPWTWSAHGGQRRTSGPLNYSYRCSCHHVGVRNSLTWVLCRSRVCS